MILVGALLGGIGLFAVLVRRTLLGVFLGLQMMTFGASVVLIAAGVATGLPVPGHIYGLFVSIAGVAQLVAGYGLCVRLFYLRKSVDLEEVGGLKH